MGLRQEVLDREEQDAAAFDSRGGGGRGAERERAGQRNANTARSARGGGGGGGGGAGAGGRAGGGAPAGARQPMGLPPASAARPYPMGNQQGQQQQAGAYSTSPLTVCSERWTLLRV